MTVKRLLWLAVAVVLFGVSRPAAATTFAHDTFDGYTLGPAHEQGHGTGWDTAAQVQGSLCSTTSNLAVGGGESGPNWVDGGSGATIAPSVFSFPGLLVGADMLSVKKSNSDLRIFRSIDMTQAALAPFLNAAGRIGKGTVFFGLMMRLSTPAPANGHCGVHLYETLPGPLQKCSASKVGERAYFGDRNLNVQTNKPATHYNFERTTQGAAGAALWDTTIPFDQTPRLVVLEIQFNTSSTCDVGVNGPAKCPPCPIDPATNMPSLCNDTVTMWIDPSAGPTPPAGPAMGPHTVMDFAFDSFSLGAGQGSQLGQEGCDFGAIAITSTFADLFVLPTNDTCATATVIDLEPDVPVDVVGTTIGAVDDYTTFCADTTPASDGQDVVYQLNVADPGTLYMSLDSTSGSHPFDGAFEVRTSACTDEHNGQGQLTLCYHLYGSPPIDIFPGTYWIVVDSVGPPGDFTLSLALTAASCGDGVVNESAGENCEPTSSNDPGCYGLDDSAPCTVKPQPTQLETCPGMPEIIAGGESVVWGPFTTIGAVDDTIGSCFGTPPHNNPHGTDQVFQVTPSASGTLTLTIGVDPATGIAYCSEPSTCWSPSSQQFVGCPVDCWAGAIYVRTTCANPATEIACDWAYSLGPWDTNPTYFVEHVSVPVTAGTPYFVFVDGVSKPQIPHSAGPYYLAASLQ